MQFLIVEDDRFFGRTISELLEDNGIQSRICCSVEEALQQSFKDYDCVVIDVMLPNNPEQSGISSEETRGGYLAGIALARKIRKENSAARIILLSGASAHSEAYEWARSSQVPFVLKEESRQELLRAIAELGLSDKKISPLAFIVHG